LSLGSQSRRGIAAGNAVISKPPSACPLTLLKIAELMEAAGLPHAAHQMITGPGTLIGDYLARAPGIQPSLLREHSRRDSDRAAAESLKKVHMELGGNDAGSFWQI
jgi:acyl-CoA reductase-like NAD-dependent aldehyde dehydrogenase